MLDGHLGCPSSTLHEVMTVPADSQTTRHELAQVSMGLSAPTGGYGRVLLYVRI